MEYNTEEWQKTILSRKLMREKKKKRCIKRCEKRKGGARSKYAERKT